MGIKGIYKEIGPGNRVALVKLAVEHYERFNRPIRIAIDTSIWQYQVQAGKGGTNPALRTFYYRLLRLLSWSIQPLFVFDGAHKPPFKRGKKTSSDVVSLPNMLAKEMLKLFGFPYHTAPGEAEAECAVLQQEGIVDAVLSEDVDTLMFGCTMSLRNWSSEGTRGNKTPTHVNVYHAKATKEGQAKLDREGMILIALMSGGDYIPAGISGCGIKTACEAARAGFGKDLSQISRKDPIGMNRWRERLDYELRTNESGYFRRKHKTLHIPSKFPDTAVLGYYTHPVVSSSEKISDLRKSVTWDRGVNIQGLRLFVADAFEWHYLEGAKKFIRGLAPALFNHYLLNRRDPRDTTGDELDLQARQEQYYVKAICGRRLHFTTDGTPELRVAYLPSNIVDLDLSREESSSYAGIDEDDSEIEPDPEAAESQQSPTRKRNPSTYDPTQLEKVWIPEMFAKVGVPLLVETWEEDMRDPKRFATRKAREREALAGGRKKKTTTIDAYAKVSKPSAHATSNGEVTSTSSAVAEPEPVRQVDVSSSSKIPSQRDHSTTHIMKLSGKTAVHNVSKPTRRVTAAKRKDSAKAKIVSKDTVANPWTFSQRSPGSSSGESMVLKDMAALQRPGMLKGHDSDSTNNKLLPHGDNGSLGPAKSQSIDSGTRTYETKSHSDVASIESTTARSRRTLDVQQPGRGRPECSLKGIGEERRQIQPLNSEKINRGAEFSARRTPIDLSSSPEQSPLPSPSSLMRSPQGNNDAFPNGEAVLVQPSQEPRTAARVGRRIMLRESLSGAWREMDQSDPRRANPQGVFEEVEILDLTET